MDTFFSKTPSPLKVYSTVSTGVRIETSKKFSFRKSSKPKMYVAFFSYIRPYVTDYVTSIFSANDTARANNSYINETITTKLIKH